MPDIFVSPDKSARPAAKSESPSSGIAHSFKGSNHLFSAFLYQPKEIRFETQEADEYIILLLRKHWITNFNWISITLILLLIPLFLFPFLQTNNILPINLPVAIVIFITLIWYLFSFSYLLVEFLLWYFTVSIVTNERIIDIDFINVLHKKFAATRISKIEDVTLKSGGFKRTIFDYGDVIIQTAGTEAQFGFYAVPHPEEVVRIINGLMEEKKGGAG